MNDTDLCRGRKEIVININETISKLTFLIKLSRQIYLPPIYIYFMAVLAVDRSTFFIKKDSPILPTTNSPTVEFLLK